MLALKVAVAGAVTDMEVGWFTNVGALGALTTVSMAVSLFAVPNVLLTNARKRKLLASRATAFITNATLVPFAASSQWMPSVLVCQRYDSEVPVAVNAKLASSP